MIVGCIGLYGERVEQALVGIRKLRPYVDRYVVIADETVTEAQIQQLKDSGCEVYVHPWEDSMVKMRNQYLDKCQTDDWVVVHDPDEVFNEQFCKDIRVICKTGEERGLDLLLINSHDTTINEDGSKTISTSDFYKNLIYRNRDGTHYEGVGEVKEVHEMLIIPGTMIGGNLPKMYWYEHIKYWWEVWERAARNVFMAGGGNNAGTRNPSWKPLRGICDSIGIDNWTKARDYFRKGNVDPRLKKWLWDNRFEGLDYDHEEMEFGRWYFEYLHPGEAEGWKPVTEVEEGSYAGIMRFIEQSYIDILGRHADQEGKEAYTKLILEGQLRKEDLPILLKQSQEYRMKSAQKTVEGMESVRVQVPVNVDVKVNQELFVEAMRRSGAYWAKIRPRLDIAKFIEDELGEEEWKSFVKWFYTEKPGLKQFVDKLNLG